MDLIGSYYDVQNWMPGVADLLSNDEQRTRTITMQDGGRLVEELLDEGAHFHHYRFTDPGPVAVQDFTARLEVTEIDTDQSEVR